MTFYQADYSAPEVVSAKDFASLESALASVPNKIQTLNVSVDITGDTRKIKDPKALIDTVYAYTSEKTDIMPGTLKDFFVKGGFVLAPERIYTNASELGIRVTFNNDLFGYRFVPGIRYSVSRGDKVLYTSDVLTVDGEVMRLDLKKEMTDDTSYVWSEYMEFGADVWWLVSLGITAVTSVIGFFLKRTMAKQDEHEKDINEIKRTYVNKDELKEFKNDVNKGLDKLQRDVDSIKENTLTRREFLQSQSKTESKIDKIYDLLIRRRNGNDS